MEDIKSILKDTGFSFKKALGQNFITDTSFLNSMVECATLSKSDTAVEIGCGAGTLTRAIAERAGKVYGFEVDKSLKPVLERSLAEFENVEIIFKDFLKINLEEFEKEVGEYQVIANLPYYVTTPLIMRLIEDAKCCKGLLIMVQEEVAERLCAKAGTPEYGAITAAVGLKASCKIVKRAPRTLFFPKPNVDSAVVKFDFGNPLEVKSEETYKKVVRAAFSSRRKTLENNLVNALSLTRDEAKRAIASCGFSPMIRGESLSPDDFKNLSDYLYQNSL